MAKRRSQSTKHSEESPGTGPQQPLPLIPAGLFPLADFRTRAITLAVIGLIFYANSFFNKYALDDDILITQNEHVQRGLKGIPKILSTDAYDSFYRSVGSPGELSGGRYRPLSIVTFAIEQEFVGVRKGDSVTWEDAPGKRLRGRIRNVEAGQVSVDTRNAEGQLEPRKVPLGDIDEFSRETLVRHVVHVVLYILSLVSLLYFLQQFIFRNNPDLAFLTALIFTIHPIHTEVVANVKSRDEVMSFLFMTLTFICAFRHQQDKRFATLLNALGLFSCVLLSKEYGITLVVLLPIMFYLFRNYSVARSAMAGMPYLIVALIFVGIRYAIVGPGRVDQITDVLNNPFVFASPMEAFATKVFILLKYLELLFFPHPLSADYSWKTFPYNDFGDPRVWISLLVHGVISVSGLILLRRRHLLAFAIFFYLFHVLLVSNLLMPIGATMGERLIYHSSLGFSIALAYLLLEAIKRLNAVSLRRTALAAVSVLLIVPAGYQTIQRNADWYDTDALFMHDARISPNSAVANANAGKAFIGLAERAEREGKLEEKKRHLDSALAHLQRAIAVHPKFVNALFNLGIAYYHLDDLDKAEFSWNEARKYFPTHPSFKKIYDPTLGRAYLNKAMREGQSKNYDEAMRLMRTALHYDPSNPEIWYSYGGANYLLRRYDEAREAFEKTLQFDPNHSQARRGLGAVMQILQAGHQPESARK